MLALIRPQVELPVPEMELFEAPRLFSCHRKLPGQFLETADYRPLTERQRDAIADQTAGLYAVLHAIPHDAARSAGATAIGPWLSPNEIAECEAYLPVELLASLTPTVDAWAALVDEPDELVFGYFDGHGWNMAFDPATGCLNGVYDFADSGFGPVHPGALVLELDLPRSDLADHRPLRTTDRTNHRSRAGDDLLTGPPVRRVRRGGTGRDDLPDRLDALRELVRSRHRPAVTRGGAAATSWSVARAQGSSTMRRTTTATSSRLGMSATRSLIEA